jgi:uncharacterized membrane protein YagU involved in acid resistance
MPRDLLNRMLHGALAGINGAATMTVLRMLAHRAGVVDEMVPQKVEQWLRRATDTDAVATVPAIHRALDHVLHFGYGAAWGALYGALFGGRRRSHVRPAIAFGLTQWGFGMTILFPALGIGRPAWRSRPRENVVNIASHLLYAAITAFLVEEFARQRRVDVTRALKHRAVG